jgi:FPC/CPF motif-containing protein YcgG
MAADWRETVRAMLAEIQWNYCICRMTFLPQQPKTIIDRATYARPPFAFCFQRGIAFLMHKA